MEGLNEQGRELEALTNRILDLEREVDVSITKLENKFDVLTQLFFELKQGKKNRVHDTALQEGADSRQSIIQPADISRFDPQKTKDGNKEKGDGEVACGCRVPDPG